MVLRQQLQKEVKPIQSYYNFVNFPQGDISSNTSSHRKTSISKPISKADAKEFAAKKHSEAERRRRLRINGQYATLRTTLPSLVKMDKASVLAETIRSVRELQKTVKELKTAYRDGDECVFPSETNELDLSYSNGDGGSLKATLSCEDKPGLMSDLAKALRSVKARVERAEMVTVGGRTKCELLARGFKGNEGMAVLKGALNLVIDKPSFPGNDKKLCFYK